MNWILDHLFWLSWFFAAAAGFLAGLKRGRSIEEGRYQYLFENIQSFRLCPGADIRRLIHIRGLHWSKLK